MYDERINVASTNAFNRGGAISAYYASDDKSVVIIMEVDDSYVIFCIFPSHFVMRKKYSSYQRIPLLVV